MGPVIAETAIEKEIQTNVRTHLKQDDFLQTAIQHLDNPNMNFWDIFDSIIDTISPEKQDGARQFLCAYIKANKSVFKKYIDSLELAPEKKSKLHFTLHSILKDSELSARYEKTGKTLNTEDASNIEELYTSHAQDIENIFNYFSTLVSGADDSHVVSMITDTIRGYDMKASYNIESGLNTFRSNFPLGDNSIIYLFEFHIKNKKHHDWEIKKAKSEEINAKKDEIDTAINELNIEKDKLSALIEEISHTNSPADFQIKNNELIGQISLFQSHFVSLSIQVNQYVQLLQNAGINNNLSTEVNTYEHIIDIYSQNISEYIGKYQQYLTDLEAYTQLTGSLDEVKRMNASLVGNITSFREENFGLQHASDDLARNMNPDVQQYKSQIQWDENKIEPTILDSRLAGARAILSRLEYMQTNPASTKDFINKLQTYRLHLTNLKDQRDQLDTLFALSSHSSLFDSTQKQHYQDALSILKTDIEKHEQLLNNYSSAILSNQTAEYDIFMGDLPEKIEEIKQFITNLEEFKAIEHLDPETERKNTNVSLRRRHLYELDSDTKKDSLLLRIKKENGPINIVKNWETSGEIDLYFYQQARKLCHTDEQWNRFSRQNKIDFNRELYDIFIERVDLASGKVILKDPATLNETQREIFEIISRGTLASYSSKKGLSFYIKTLYKQGALNKNDVDALTITTNKNDRTTQLDTLISQLKIIRETKDDIQKDQIDEMLSQIESIVPIDHSPHANNIFLIKALILLVERQKYDTPELPKDVLGVQVPQALNYNNRVPEAITPVCPNAPAELPDLGLSEISTPEVPLEPNMDISEVVLSERLPAEPLRESDIPLPIIDPDPEPTPIPEEDDEEPEIPEIPQEPITRRIIISNIEAQMRRQAEKIGKEKFEAYMSSIGFFKSMKEVFTDTKTKNRLIQESFDELKQQYQDRTETILDMGNAAATRINNDEAESLEILSNQHSIDGLSQIAREFVLGNIDKQQVRIALETEWGAIVAAHPDLTIEFFGDDLIHLLTIERARFTTGQELINLLIDGSLSPEDINKQKDEILSNFKQTFKEDLGIESIDLTNLSDIQRNTYAEAMAGVLNARFANLQFVVQASTEGATANRSLEDTKLGRFGKVGEWFGKHPAIRFISAVVVPMATTCILPGVGAGIVAASSGGVLSGTLGGAHRSYDMSKGRDGIEARLADGDDYDPSSLLATHQGTTRPSFWRHPIENRRHKGTETHLEREQALLETLPKMRSMTELKDGIMQDAMNNDIELSVDAEDYNEFTQNVVELLVRYNLWKELKHNFLSGDDEKTAEQELTDALLSLDFALREKGLNRTDVVALDLYSKRYDALKNEHLDGVKRFEELRQKESLVHGIKTGAAYAATSLTLRYLINGTVALIKGDLGHQTAQVTVNNATSLKTQMVQDGLDPNKVEDVKTFASHHPDAWSLQDAGNDTTNIVNTTSDIVIDPKIDPVLHDVFGSKYSAFVAEIKSGGHAKYLYDSIHKVLDTNGVTAQAKNAIVEKLLTIYEGNSQELVDLSVQNNFSFKAVALEHAVKHLDGLHSNLSHWALPSEQALDATKHFCNAVHAGASEETIKPLFEALPGRIQAEVRMDFVHAGGKAFSKGLDAIQDLFMDVSKADVVAGTIKTSLKEGISNTLSKFPGIPTLRRWFLGAKKPVENQ